MKKWPFLFVFLLLPVYGMAAVWYDEYDAGLKAIAAKDWTSAEARLNKAIQLQPKQGRQVLAYGVRFVRYIPQYYLGVVHFHQGRYAEALQRLEKIQKAQLIAKGDPEFSEMIRMLQLATEQLKPKAEEKKAPVTEEPKATPALEDPKAKERLQQAQQLEEEKRKREQLDNGERLKKKDLTEKLDALANAMNKKDWVAAQALATQVASLDPKNSELIRSKSLIDDGLLALKAQDLEDRGFLAFFSGDYQQAIMHLELVIAAKKDSAETWFYLGCSHAALGLLQGKEGKQLLQKAQHEFAETRKFDPKLDYLPGLISPRIRDLYQQSQ